MNDCSNKGSAKKYRYFKLRRKNRRKNRRNMRKNRRNMRKNRRNMR
jgi:hypothetical protein